MATILTYDEFYDLREKSEEAIFKGEFISPQKGFQERVLSQCADIQIIGGERGGGKSASLLLAPLQDCENPNFTAVIIRREMDDLKRGGGLWQTSAKFYSKIATQMMSDSTWEFKAGSKLKFEHMANENKADQRFRGQQISLIEIDEIDQILESTFWFLLSSNRNAHGIKNRIIGTCNPNGESWVRRLIDWWIGVDGYPIPEREGVIRYFFKHGETIDDIIWGNSKEEVYAKAKHEINRLLRPELRELVSPYDLIKSLVFIRGRMEENPILLKSDPGYAGSIAQGGAEKTAKEMEGNWNTFSSKEELLSASELRAVFNNPSRRNGIKSMTIDAALEGGDKFIIWVWDGNHAFDISVHTNISAPELINQVKLIARRYDILNHRITYDANGIGAFMGSKNQLKGFIPGSIRFIGNGAPKDKSTFYQLKDEITNEFILAAKNQEISFDADLLQRRFGDKTIEEHLQNERKSLRWITEGGVIKDKYRLITKKEMRKIIGCSPDFMDSLKMKMYDRYKAAQPNYIQYIY